MRKYWIVGLFALIMALVPYVADAKSLFVRSTTACANNGDGLAYGCAASAGAVGAYRGTNNILWATAVVPGDVVFICGEHLINNASLRITPTISGTPGNDITISGDCPSDPGILNGQFSAAGIRLVNLGSTGPINHFIVDRLVFKNVLSANDYALFVYDAVSSGAFDRYITITNNTFQNIGWIGMWIWGGEIIVANNTMDSIGEDAIYIKGGKNTKVVKNHISNVSVSGAGGDCIQFDSSATQATVGTGTVIVTGNVCDKKTSPNVKYGILVGPVTGLTIIEDNVIDCPISTTLSTGCNPIYVNAAGTAMTAQVIVRGNKVSKGWRGITIATANNVNVRHMVVGNIIVDAGTFGTWLDANTDNVDVLNNIFAGNLEYGLYLGKVTTTHRVANNVFYKNASGLFYLNPPGFGHKYNNYWQQTVSDIRDAGGPKTLDPTEMNADPMFIFVTDWKPAAGSPLIDAGEPQPLVCPDRLLYYCIDASNIGVY